MSSARPSTRSASASPSKLIRPLNHSYIPNIANLARLPEPVLRPGLAVHGPYTIYTTGIAWRKDKVNLTPSWKMPWQGGAYKGKVAILDDYRESLSLALMKPASSTSTPPNAGRSHGRGHVAARAFGQLTNVRIDNNDYTDVPSGKTWIHHAWSGDMARVRSTCPRACPPM